MLNRPMTRLALVAAAGLVLAAAGRAEAGPPRYSYHGHHGLSRQGHFGLRFHQARSRLHHRVAHGRYGYYGPGVRRHHGLGHGGYPNAGGVRRYHGLGDGYCSPHHASRYWNAVRPYHVVPYPYAGEYGYGGWVTVGAPDYHRTSEPPVVEVVSTQPAGAAPAEPKPTPSEIAWGKLSRGEARAALREFAVLALRSTRSAEPRAGYGLAAAMLSKHETAVWAMRRAIDTDAVALRNLALDERLDGPLRRLAGHYSERAGRLGAGDGLFMAAALHFLLHEDDAARAAIAAAIERGDTEPTTKALDDLLAAEQDRDEAAPVVVVQRLAADE
jgi:hypothetical protein